MSSRTGCNDLEALYAQRHPLCPEVLPGIPADHCRITNDLCKVEGCQLLSMPQSDNKRSKKRCVKYDLEHGINSSIRLWM